MAGWPAGGLAADAVSLFAGDAVDAELAGVEMVNSYGVVGGVLVGAGMTVFPMADARVGVAIGSPRVGDGDVAGARVALGLALGPD